jgi:hypothetical protein
MAVCPPPSRSNCITISDGFIRTRRNGAQNDALHAVKNCNTLLWLLCPPTYYWSWNTPSQSASRPSGTAARWLRPGWPSCSTRSGLTCAACTLQRCTRAFSSRSPADAAPRRSCRLRSLAVTPMRAHTPKTRQPAVSAHIQSHDNVCCRSPLSPFFCVFESPGCLKSTCPRGPKPQYQKPIAVETPNMHPHLH